MGPFSSFTGRLARWSVCLAALLSFAAAALGPTSHLHPADGTLVLAAEEASEGSGPEHDSKQPSPHDEIGCFVCQTLTAPGTPVLAHPAPIPDPISRLSNGELRQPHSRLHSSAPQARAPPSA